LDPDAKPENLKKLIATELPSGLSLREFQFTERVDDHR
jgi:hypothetical protein